MYLSATISNFLLFAYYLLAFRLESILVSKNDEDESDAESEFDERTIELESWLAEWMAEKELGSAARALFPGEAFYVA